MAVDPSPTADATLRLITDVLWLFSVRFWPSFLWNGVGFHHRAAFSSAKEAIKWTGDRNRAESDINYIPTFRYRIW